MRSVHALFLAPFLAVACTATPDPVDDPVEADVQELRALSAVEILGDIAAGETKTVAYVFTGAENSRYRAYRYTAKAGDELDVWVKSSDGGNARAWLLDAQFRNVATNDDASASTRDSHIHRSITAGGTFYVAFRDAALEDATFTVRLDATQPSGCDPEEDNCEDPGGGTGGHPLPGIFEDSWLAGTPITAAAAVARFAPGATRVEVGTFRMAERVRSCNGTTGCAGWVDKPVALSYEAYDLWIPGPGWSAQKACFTYVPVTYPSFAGSAALLVTANGNISLELNRGPSIRIVCDAITSGSSSCSPIVDASVSVSPSPCFNPNRVGAGNDKVAFPDNASSSSPGGSLRLSARVTADYAYARTTRRSESGTTGNYTEAQYALYASLKNGPLP